MVEAGQLNSLTSKRLVSVDVFRGFSIAGMILIDNLGDPNHYYYHLKHANFNGWSFADLIFPFFLFIVGIVMPMSLDKCMKTDDSRKHLLLHALKRSLILFCLGLVLNLPPSFSIVSLRIPGVLQTIAFAYFFAALIVINFRIRWQVVFAVFFVLIYWVLMKMVPIPNYGAGVLTKEANLAFYIDNLFLHGHMMHRYSDPDGIFSTIPAVSTVLTGVLAGHLLKSGKGNYRKLSFFLISGIIGIGLGLYMDRWFPINKVLWSPSFTVMSAGFALLFFAVCCWLVDLSGYRRWGLPFVVYGRNAITVYILSSLFNSFTLWLRITQPDGSVINLKTYLFENLLMPWASPVNASLLYAITLLLFWLLIAFVLYRKKIFVKI